MKIYGVKQDENNKEIANAVMYACIICTTYFYWPTIKLHNAIFGLTARITSTKTINEFKRLSKKSRESITRKLNVGFVVLLISSQYMSVVITVQSLKG